MVIFIRLALSNLSILDHDFGEKERLFFSTCSVVFISKIIGLYSVIFVSKIHTASDGEDHLI